jgi:hypothetical protein
MSTVDISWMVTASSRRRKDQDYRTDKKEFRQAMLVTSFKSDVSMASIHCKVEGSSSKRRDACARYRSHAASGPSITIPLSYWLIESYMLEQETRICIFDLTRR